MKDDKGKRWLRTMVLPIALPLLVAPPLSTSANGLFASDPPPGLYNNDGTQHIIHSLSPPVNTINIVDAYGADPEDNGNDDAAAIRQAIADAGPGDEIYLPNGTYNLNTVDPSDGTTNILLKSGVYIRGESRAGVILKSAFDNVNGSAVIRGKGVHHILLSHFSISSTWDRTFSSTPSVPNPDVGGPDYGLRLHFSNDPSYNVTVDDVKVARFKKHGINISNSRDVVVQNSLIAEATDVGSGGSGYGITIQGVGKMDRNNDPNDSAYNVIQNNEIQGPYIRHGILLQQFTHNNVLRNNTIVDTANDSIDLHGEDEYLNEMYGNVISGSGGNGIGLGNNGGTNSHDATGRRNDVHDNDISNSKRGISVNFQTPGTIIERNNVHDSVYAGGGINLGNAPYTLLRNNSIAHWSGTGTWGIQLTGDSGTGESPAGNPDHSQVYNNMVAKSAGGLKIAAGDDIAVGNNTLTLNTTDSSITVPVIPITPDTSAPVAPTGLTATSKTDSRVTLAWNALSDSSVNGYLIYNGTELVGTTAGQTSFEVVNLTSATTYTFTVKGKDEGGNAGVPSSGITVTTDSVASDGDTINPSKPKNLINTGVTGNSASLVWTGSSDNVAVAGYNVYKGRQLYDFTTATSYTAYGLEPGKSYNFAVRAVDTSGNVSGKTPNLTVVTDDHDTNTILDDRWAGSTKNTFNYVKTWSVSNDAIHYLGRAHVSNTTDAYYEVKFIGNQISITAMKSPDFGVAAVSIDGGTETNVDFYAASPILATAWTSPTLTNGDHTLKVRVTGTKNASADDFYVPADRLDVVCNP